MAKVNGFPESVQPGLPKLRDVPDGWEQTHLGKYLEEIRRPAVLEDDKTYTLVTVKRSRGGVIERGRLLGRQILVKSQFYVREGDFLISKRQIVHGACGLVPPELDGAVVSNEYAVLRASGDFYLPFLKHLSESVYFQQTCFHSSIGVHIEKMIFKMERWLNWPFNLPRFAEQERIFDLLSTWDMTIETIEKLIDNSLVQKKALMQQLLTGNRRFSEFRQEKTSVRRLGDYCVFRGGNGFKELYQGHRQGDFPFIKVSDMGIPGNEVYINNSKNWISEETRQKIGGTLMPPGCIVFAKVGAALLLNRRRIIKRNTLIDNNMMAAIPKSDIDPLYLYFLLCWIDFARLVQEGALPSVNQSALGSLKVRIPSISEQRRIVTVLLAAENEVNSLKRNHSFLTEEKQALMQQLLTGKRRVKIDDTKEAA